MAKKGSGKGSGKAKAPVAGGGAGNQGVRTGAEAALKAAYDRLTTRSFGGADLGFVSIPALRDALGYPRSEFDALLRDLWRRNVLQPSVGDPNDFTPAQIRDSFRSEDGTLFQYVTLT